ncbi:MAG: hypothetical protein HYT94_02470 [Parcubacteria group bacterium]|nr:hypothetical protein [Parcubacteria group bacterium]
MTPLLQFSLIAHVILGIAGVAASYAVWLHGVKKIPPVSFLKISAGIAFFSFLFSWIAGAYYYVSYYGTAVKPIIKAGAFPWAHNFFMEMKEHVFLLLPFLSLVVFGTLLVFGEEIAKEENIKLKQAFSFLSGVVALLGFLIAVSGIVISGAAR